MSQTLAEKIYTVESIPYNHANLIATIFHAINEYSTMAEASGSPTTLAQLIYIVMIAFTDANIFASDIRMWNENTLPQNTWKSCKIHFYQAQKSTNKSQPQKILSDIGFH